MTRFIVGRLMQTVVTVLLLTMLVFVLVRMTGDPSDMLLPIDATPDMRESFRRELGLDQPIYVQYARFLGGLSQGDLGTSIRTKKPVADLIGERFSNSVGLVLVSMVMATAIAFPLGVMSAVKKGTMIDTAARGISIIGQSVPSFWAGILFILFFGVHLGLLPTSRSEGGLSFVLPAITTAFFGFMLPGIVRLLRSSMLEVLDSEYVKLARIKGVSEREVIWKHGLRNALIPVVTFMGLYFGILLSGSVIVETVFAWPGIGRLASDAVTWRDYPLIQGILLLVSIVVLIGNLLVDICYAYLDPRIRYS